jgi:RHS repeat-associated protein
LIAEYDQNGSLTKTYGYRPNSQWTTDPLFQKIGDSYYWYKNDAQATPQKIVDTSGRVVWEARYDAFGNCAVITQEIENNLRLAGQYYDAETGLYYNYHRYYDPVTGRYLQTDPYREGLNLYAYCHNNPNSFIDPMGLCMLKKLKGLGKDLVRLLRNRLHSYFTPFYAIADWLGSFDNPIMQLLGAGYYAGWNFMEKLASGPIGLLDNYFDFMFDPLNWRNIPILGPMIAGPIDAISEAWNNPNADTICQAAEAVLWDALAVLLAAESAGVGRGAPESLGKGIDVPENLPKDIHSGAQGKHVPGDNNYIPGRSPLADGINPQQLLNGVHSGQYPIIRLTPKNEPIVDFGKTIGYYNGTPTQYGIIHSSKYGAHIVPANPIQY